MKLIVYRGDDFIAAHSLIQTLKRARSSSPPPAPPQPSWCMRRAGGDGPVPDPNDYGTTVEGVRDLREVARPDQPLGTEDQLLTTTAQRHARQVAERNHDVHEAVQEVDLVDERRCPAPLEFSVQR